LTYKVTRVTTIDELVSNKDKVLHYLNKVLVKAPEVTVESVLTSIQKGDSQLWLITEEDVVGIVVTNLVTYPTTKRLLIHLCGGQNIRDWIALYMQTIEEWSKSKGLDGIEIQGRKGWLKLLPDYSCDRVLMIKEF